MGNNFEVVKCTLQSKLISLGLLHILKIMGKFRNMNLRKQGVKRQDVTATIFILMLVCLLVFLCFFLSLFICSFSFSLPFKEATLIWMEYNTLYYLFVSALVCSRYICYTNISVLEQRNFKGHCNGPTPLSYDIKKLVCYNKMVSCMTVQRKLKEKVTYTHNHIHYCKIDR